jgi:hypothetical protein
MTSMVPALGSDGARSESPGCPRPGSGQDEQSAELGGYPAGAGHPPPPPRSRRGVLIAIAAVLGVILVAGAVGIGVALHGSSSGSFRLPGKLLGINRSSGPLAEQVDEYVRTHLGSDSSYAQVAFYGSNSGRGFVVVAGWPSSAAQADRVPSVLTTYMRGRAKDTRSFPPGPAGGALGCGHVTVNRGPIGIVCVWVGKMSIGVVTYEPGFASGLGDAAAKTIQIRAAVDR